jgi:hypothetical protein
MSSASADALLVQIGNDQSEAAMHARAVLTDPGVGLLASTGSEPARHWLRVWRIKRENAERKGTTTQGFDEAFKRLGSLPPESPLWLVTYQLEIPQLRWAMFWLDEIGAIVAFTVLWRPEAARS